MIVAYKGFKSQEEINPVTGKELLRCRDFIYEEGQTYYEPDAKLCERGFHACKYPLDVFLYYLPNIGKDSKGQSVKYHRVILDEVSGEKDIINSKIVGKKITILEELPVSQMIEEAKAYADKEFFGPFASVFEILWHDPYLVGFLIKDKVENAVPIIGSLSGFGWPNNGGAYKNGILYTKYDSEKRVFVKKSEFMSEEDITEKYSLWRGLPTQEKLDEYYREREKNGRSI